MIVGEMETWNKNNPNKRVNEITIEKMVKLFNIKKKPSDNC